MGKERKWGSEEADHSACCTFDRFQHPLSNLDCNLSFTPQYKTLGYRNSRARVILASEAAQPRVLVS